MALCNNCGESFSTKRYDLGYRTCLDCGGRTAQELKSHRAKCVSPIYNKGAYVYVSDASLVKGIRR